LKTTVGKLSTRGESFPTVVLDEMTRVSRSKTTVFKVLLLESCSRTTIGNILLFVLDV